MGDERLPLAVRATELGAGGDVCEQRLQQLQEGQAVGDVEGDDMEHLGVINSLKHNDEATSRI